MPTYEYVCTSCGHRLEAVQSFSDPALTVCPDCQGVLRKVFGNVGIVLKGSGFYKNDSRGAKSSSSTSSESTADSSSAPAESSAPAADSSKTPAPAVAASTTETSSTTSD
jgi:putative FmdB family regulatory protein